MHDHLSARVAPLYERHARDWDRDRNHGVKTWNDRYWHDRFCAALPTACRILDLGCGSGYPVARHFADAGHRITGVDAAPSMIDLCRGRLPGHEWLVADMRSVALGRMFDGILAWDSYFFLPPDDQRRMFARFAAHAAPSAYLMFNAGPRHGEAIGAYRGEPLYHASLDPTEYRALLADVGFDVLDHVIEDRRAGGRTVWLAQMRVVR